MFQRLRIIQNTPRPLNDHLALFGQTLKPIGATDNGDAQPILKIADAHRKGRLRNPTFLSRLGKMAMPRKGAEQLEVADFDHYCFSRMSDE